MDEHDHALACLAVVGGVASWVCPGGAWSCPIGEYDESNWPPTDLDAEDVPDRVINRILRRDIKELREAHPERREDGWVILAGVWPMTDAVIARLSEIAAPVGVEAYPQPGQSYAA